MKFDWDKFLKDLRWADPMKDYRTWHGGSMPKTQKERAEILGTNQPKLSRIESGDKNLTVDQLSDFCDALKTDPAKYFVKLDEDDNLNK